MEVIVAIAVVVFFLWLDARRERKIHDKFKYAFRDKDEEGP
jgi:hypothetical protein